MKATGKWPPGTALVDSSAHFALLNRRDASHEAALRIRDGLVRERWRLCTTSFIITETHALLLARLNRELATAFLRQLEGSALKVIWVTPRDVRQAQNIVYRYDDKDFSLTDATSFAVMERLGITHAFTFDHHFAQYGFTLLTPGSF